MAFSGARERLTFVIDVDTTEAERKIRKLSRPSQWRLSLLVLLLVFGVYLVALTAAPGDQPLQGIAGGFLLGLYVDLSYPRARPSTGGDR